MKKFPKFLSPGNYNRLKEYQYNRALCYVRKFVYESMLVPTFSIPKNCGISLQGISLGEMGDRGCGYKVDGRITAQIQQELEALGWKTKVSYGGTVLFVYIDEQPEESVHCVGFE